MLKLRVYAKEMTSKDGKSKFMTFSIVGGSLKGTNLKFTQDANSDLEVKLPRENGYYLFSFKEDNAKAISVAKGIKNEDGKTWKKYPVAWVRDGLALVSVERDTKYEEERAKQNQELLKGSDVETTDANLFGE